MPSAASHSAWGMDGSRTCFDKNLSDASTQCTTMKVDGVRGVFVD